MGFLVRVLVLSTIVVIFGSNSATSKNYPIAKPHCTDRCGNVSIPFPFGMTDECSLDKQFFINCKNSTPLLGHSGNMEVKNIYVEGQVILMQTISHRCYDGKGKLLTRFDSWYTSESFKMYVNQTANKFVAIGCDTVAKVAGYLNFNASSEQGSNRTYLTGCIATCNGIRDVKNGTCAGVGCCETTYIPSLVRNIEFTMNSMTGYNNADGSVSNCSYAFVVDKREFNFSSDMLTKIWDVNQMPMVLDWIIPDTYGNCKNNKQTICQKNTKCVDFGGPDGGYRCACNNGYEGNPYLSPGCKDIDECEEQKHQCNKNAFCSNTLGSYNCTCNKDFQGNGMGESGCVPKDECKGKGCSTSKAIKLALGIALATILLLISGFCLYLEFRRRESLQKRDKFYKENGGLILEERIADLESSSRGSGKPRHFTAQELERATNNYDKTGIIGEGGFGTVYKGKLLDGRVVAVKKAKTLNPTQAEQFINEVIMLSQINHKNIVKLFGCCLETEIPLLVYEFITNGTLSEHIHNKDKASTIPWLTRLRIATETADVLSYLHSSVSPPIIHRDIKSVNILLDDGYTAKVADFGASRLVPQDQTHVSTIVQGTFGYLDPEYMETQTLTEKSDVYSFGVVLAELLTSRTAIYSSGPERKINLSEDFLSFLRKDRLFEILDNNIVCEGNTEELLEVALLAKRCLNEKGEDRPTMKEVAVELDGLRRAGKHSWTHDSQTSIESQALHNEAAISSFGYEVFSITNTEYDSLRDHMELPVAGGGR